MKLLYGLPTFDAWDAFDRVLATSDTQVASSSQIVVPSEYGGGQVVFTGSFTVVGGIVTGGTMTGFQVFANQTKVIVGLNYSTDAVLLSDAINELQMGNWEPIYALISEIPIKIVGSDQDDYIWGNSVNYRIQGRGGNDILEGAMGTGTLKGGKGDDLLIASLGQETMSGGIGADVFLFDSLESTAPVDKIKDFISGEDLISIRGDVNEGVLPGFLLATQFHKGTMATTADQRIIYDKKAGKLYYDGDGTGSEAQFQFAKITPGTKLSADSFIVQEFLPV
jgi:hypothetical protein